MDVPMPVSNLSSRKQTIKVLYFNLNFQLHLDKKGHILTRGQFFMWHVRMGKWLKTRLLQEFLGFVCLPNSGVWCFRKIT